MNTSIISFSGRPNGNCSGIAKWLKRRWSEEAVLFDFSELTVAPCGRCDYECFHSRENCPWFSDPEFEMCCTVANSELACFILPNYCDYPPANFFIFNERSQCCFQHHQGLLEKYLAVRKKFIVVSNTNRENFASALCYHVPEGTPPDILFLSAREFHKVSIHGDLLDSEEARNAILHFVEE